jgi:hypothetical protein
MLRWIFWKSALCWLAGRRRGKAVRFANTPSLAKNAKDGAPGLLARQRFPQKLKLTCAVTARGET